MCSPGFKPTGQIIPWLLLTLLLLLSKQVFCQEKDTMQTHVVSALQRFDSLITIKMIVSNDIEGLSVNSESGDIILNPNAQVLTKFNVSYRYISFGFSMAPALLQQKNNKYLQGSSKIRNIGINLNGRHWQQAAFYSRTRGYYLENTSDYDPSWHNGIPFIHFPDLLFKQFYGSTAYSFNDRFSPNAVISQTERQLLSAGSFIPVLSYRYSISDDRSPLAPGRQTQKTRNFELSLGPGYHYTWVHRKQFYISGGLTVSGGVVFSNIENRSGNGSSKGRQRNGLIRLDGTVGIGYNGNRFFGSIYGRAIGSSFRQAHTSVINNDDRVMAHVMVGYRIQAPSIVKRIMAQSDDQLERIKSSIKN